MKKIKIRLVKSLIGRPLDHKSTIKGLGLRKLNSVSELNSTPAILGMIKKVSYMLEVLDEAK